MNDTLKILAFIVRVALGIIFIAASIDKIIHPAEFAKIIHNYRLMPGFLINLWAITLPWIELICGILLTLGLFREGAFSVITALIIIFVIAVGINVVRGVNLDCGCFTVSEHARGNALLVLIRDFGLLAMAIFVYLFDSVSTGLDRFRKKSLATK